MTTRYYPWPAVEPASPTGHVVSALCVDKRGGHDHVRLWSRGGLAGEVVLDAGDGALLAASLGLLEDTGGGS